MSFFESKEDIINVFKQSISKGDKFEIDISTNEGTSHYCSDIIRLTLKYEQDGIESRKSLIIKVPVNTNAGLHGYALMLFNRESFVYNEIIPLVNNYLDEPLTPFHIKTTDSRIIILENLSARGYTIETNNRPVYGQKECSAIIKALANFHATSHKIGQTKRHLVENEIFQCQAMVIELRQSITRFGEPILIELLTRNKAVHFIPKLKNAFLPLKGDDDYKLKMHHSNFQFVVLNHGDFRGDNAILKYGPQDTVEVKIIDFQTSFWSTPIYDFMHFVLPAADTELIDKHFDRLVDWYLQCLNEQLKELNCTQQYSRQDFQDDIKKAAFCSFLCIPGTLFFASQLDGKDRCHLVEEVAAGKMEAIPHYMDLFLKDEFLMKKVLGVVNLCEKLGLFETCL